MNGGIFHQALADKQAACLSDLRDTRKEDFPVYAKNWFNTVIKQLCTTDTDKDLASTIVAAFPSCVNKYKQDSTLNSNKTQLKHLPFKWKLCLCAIILLLAFLFALVGTIMVAKASISALAAAFFPILGLAIGLALSYYWATSRLGLGKEMHTSTITDGIRIDSEEAYNNMMLVADAIDGVLEIVHKGNNIVTNPGTRLTTDLLIAMQRLIGSSRRGDGADVLFDYIEDLETALQYSGIKVLHYSEDNKAAFETTSGKLHDIEILPAISDDSGVIIPGKYMI